MKGNDVTSNQEIPILQLVLLHFCVAANTRINFMAFYE